MFNYTHLRAFPIVRIEILLLLYGRCATALGCYSDNVMMDGCLHESLSTGQVNLTPPESLRRRRVYQPVLLVIINGSSMRGRRRLSHLQLGDLEHSTRLEHESQPPPQRMMVG